MSALHASAKGLGALPGLSSGATTRSVRSRPCLESFSAKGKGAARASPSTATRGDLARPSAGGPDGRLLAQAEDLSVQESVPACTAEVVPQPMQNVGEPVSRRNVLAAPLAQLLAGTVLPTVTSVLSPIVTASMAFPALPALANVVPARIDASTQPSASFDPTDEGLRRAAEIFQSALDAKSVRRDVLHHLPPA